MGSSPLSRGILRALMGKWSRRRIIPALAGNTMTYGGPARRCRDHPRSRGEYAFSRYRKPGFTGSSPLSRGIHQHPQGQRLVRRIIPALAGNTTGRGRIFAKPWDHPRSRGEYSWNGVVCHDPSRIIPALAGNTGRIRTAVPRCRDHPRSRGEYATRTSRATPSIGSSPLSRGILTIHIDGDPVLRIIPALAGNTRTMGCREKNPWDHPRSRGEY